MGWVGVVMGCQTGYKAGVKNAEPRTQEHLHSKDSTAALKVQLQVQVRDPHLRVV